ncbi:hypothetical protein [Undibacterium sp. RuTC16W]|uniref:hypothetical protein n=1 Tax=Undibacterium sp. RuTC16W TaxID=3413048 RepID=UPI003BF16591
MLSKLLRCVAVCVVVSISGCGSAPVKRDEIAGNYLKQAEEKRQASDIYNFSSYVDRALYQSNGAEKVKAYFAITPAARKSFKDFQIGICSEVSSPQEANIKLGNLMSLSKDDILTSMEISECSALIEKQVIDGNLNGKVAFDLGDNTDAFPILKNSPHIELIVNRTIKHLQENKSNSRPVTQLMAYIEKGGVGSPLAKKVSPLLSSMNIKRSEFESVAKVYPDFVRMRMEMTPTRVFTQFKNADRLLSDDIQTLLKNKFDKVQWVTTSDENTVTLNIDRLRNDERVIPESAQTITYGFFDVNIVYASLYMPKNASYLYDIITGGAQIEYGYEVTAFKGGKKIFDDVARGRVGGESSRCQNQRVQNVFGGVSPANFVANDDMQRRCSSNSTVSIDRLRNEVLTYIVSVVGSIPEIKEMQELN